MSRSSRPLSILQTQFLNFLSKNNNLEIGLTMAEAVVSVALETFRDLLLEEGRFLSGVGDQVKALQTQLKEMQSLLKDADGKQHESESVRNWIAEIRDLAYRAEDVIETYAVDVSSKRGRGLRNLLRRFSCIMKEFHSLHRLGSEISQIKSDLAGVSKSMQDYGIIKSIIQGESSGSSTNDDNRQWKRQSFPDFQIQDCFVGKDDELKRIVSLLVDDDGDQHRILSIWGMGGLGKTTIARRAYNHADTKRYFQCFAWVCITQQCQIRSVLEEVLRQLNPSKREAMSNRELIEELCRIQKDKRCIVVLDDLWETHHWEGLKHAFVVEGLKSKILVTTRKQKVAEIGLPIKLGLLSMESGWELLKNKAFPHTIDTNITDPDIAFDGNLVRKVGKEMVQKCGFLPLTITLLGGVLSKKKSIREWELVKENINAYLYRGDGIENENEIEAVLNLSYEDLPYYLKPCFLYLGLLVKEDRRVHANYIYNTWIAQGMISRGNREDESLVVTAELYLSELASRSIVQVEVQFDEDFKSGKRYSWCKLHDVVRDLCLCVAKREGFGVQSLVYEGGKLMHGSLQSNVKTRHLAIYFEGQNEAPVDGGDQSAISTCNNLRSLVLVNGNEEKIEFLDIAIDLHIFKLLRVLRFDGLKFERRKVPKGIGNLIHLRYLGFQRCELDKVPSSVRNLSYLQTLDLETSWDVRVPNVFNKLLRLKHLILPGYSHDRVGDFALELDKGLDELETLRGFDSSMHRLESITRLKNLQSFRARIRDNESLSVVIDVVGKEWNKLQFCSIFIREGCNITSSEEGLMVLQKVLACPNIHQLLIYVKIGKQLGECRNHVSSSQIVQLCLCGCEVEDDPMEILGKLPVLRELDLWMDSFVGEEMTCPAFSFPRLRKLQLEKLRNLREWRVEEGAMPLLSKIRMEECPDLRMLPDGLRFISTLQELRITKMPGLGKRVLASEEDGGEGDGEGEDFDKVRHVPSIIINN